MALLSMQAQTTGSRITHRSGVVNHGRVPLLSFKSAGTQAYPGLITQEGGEGIYLDRAARVDGDVDGCRPRDMLGVVVVQVPDAVRGQLHTVVTRYGLRPVAVPLHAHEVSASHPEKRVYRRLV